MVKFKIVLFIFLSSCISLMYGNSTIDSLKQELKLNREDTTKVHILNKLCGEYQTIGEYDSVLYYGNAALKLAEKLNFSEGIASAYNNIGIINYYKGDYNLSLKNYISSLKAYQEMDKNDKSAQNGIANEYNNIGMVYQNLSKYTEALENYTYALKIREKIGSKKNIADSYSNIGIIHALNENYSVASENFKKALQLKIDINDKNGIARLYNNIGSNLQNHGVALQKEGEIKQAKLNFEQAFENYFAGLKIQEKLGDRRSVAMSCSNIGGTYFYTENYLQSKQWFLKALNISLEIGEKYLITEIYKGLAETDEKLGDYKEAYHHHKLYLQYKDSIFSEESTKQIAEMQTKYEAEKKQNIIVTQNLQLSKQQLQLTQNKILFILLLVGAMVIFIGAYLIITKNKIKHREILQKNILSQQKLHTKTLIETLEQERVRIARDLHDGIGQSLAAVITNHEQLITESACFSEDKKQLLNTSTTVLDNAYKELREISHQMMPRALKIAGLPEAISDVLDKSLSNTQLNYNFEKQPIIDLPENISIGIYRIFQELLSNIIKHSKATTINIILHKTHQQVILIVEDNGIGIKNNINSNEEIKKISTGIGLMNIISRTQIMNGTFLMEKGKLNGTITTLMIPLH